MAKIFKTLVLILALVIVVNARRRRPNMSAINNNLLSGAKTATRGDYPWLVSFVASTVLFCSGSLIDTNWVLTSAQCVTMPDYNYYVTFGGTNTAVGESERLIIQSVIGIVHPDYNANTLANDIALLKLQAPITLSAYVQPIRLPRSSDASNLFVGTKANVSGWTYIINYRKKIIGNTLHYVNTAIINNTECQRRLPKQKISSLVLCSYLPGRTPCIGDVGGSIVYMESDNKPTQIGITSYVNKGCPKDAAMTYTKVANYLPWIYSSSGVTERM